jgi:hypothetical protein
LTEKQTFNVGEYKYFRTMSINGIYQNKLKATWQVSRNIGAGTTTWLVGCQLTYEWKGLMVSSLCIINTESDFNINI